MKRNENGTKLKLDEKERKWDETKIAGIPLIVGRHPISKSRKTPSHFLSKIHWIFQLRDAISVNHNLL
jgi:hypothetical protein